MWPLRPAGRALFLSLLFALSPLTAPAQVPNAWINELHYDNAGGDTDEFVEVVIEDAGIVDLNRFQMLHYNDADGDPDAASPVTLDEFSAGTTVDEFSLYSYNYTDNGESLQNGAEALALCFDSNDDGTFDALLASGGTDQFLSYEGTLTGTDGAGCAGGETSTQIGADESTPSPVGESVQLEGSGTSYSDFAWTGPLPSTPGAVNTGQTLGGSGPITVDDDGPADYASIQAAIDAAGAGTTIEVLGGLYTEDVTADKELTLEGSNAGTPGNGSRGSEATIEGRVILSASGVVFDGFDVSPPPAASNTAGEALRVGSGSNAPDDVVVKNNIVRDFSEEGIDEDVGGIVAFGGTTDPLENVTISSNLIEDVTRTTDGYGAVGISIQGNVSGATVTENTVRNISKQTALYGFGIVVRGSENPGGPPSGITVTNNDISSVLSDPGPYAGVGFGVEDGSVASVTGNALSNTELQAEDKTFSLDLIGFIDSNTLDRAAVILDGSGGVKDEDAAQRVYSSIGAPASRASAGETVQVYDGTYAETVTVDKPLTLQDASTPTVNAFEVAADGVTIDGFEITGGTTSATPNATVGIFVQAGTSGHVFKNNDLNGPGAGGQVRGLLTGSGSVTDVTIRDNVVSGWTSGVFLNPGAEAFDIEDNEIRDNTAGIGSDGIADVHITGNRIEDNEQGIGASDVGPEVTAEQNCITGNASAGVESSGGEILTASGNYWGAANGPGGIFPGSGDAVLGPVTVDFSPEPVAACPNGDPTPDCEATTLSESVTPPENGDPGVVTATFTNTDGLEEIKYTLLDNFTVTGEPDDFTRNGDTWTAGDLQNPPTTAVFDLTQTTIGDPSTYFAIAASTCPTQDDGQLEVNFDPVHELPPDAPTAMQFAGNAPNPFGDRTTIEFALPEQADVTLAVYDMMGRRVATLVDGPARAGTHQIPWNGRAGNGQVLASGVYLLRLTTAEQAFTKRMTLVR